MLRNTLMTSWRVMNRGFTRMSPEANSNRLFGYSNNESSSHSKLFQTNSCLFLGKLAATATAEVNASLTTHRFQVRYRKLSENDRASPP